MPEDSWGYLDPEVPTLADELKKAGYHTAIIGKWHLGLESPNTPNERGFDFFHGFLGDMMDSYTTHLRHGNNYLRRNARDDRAGGPRHRSVLRLGRRYLRERAKHRDQPFFLYLAYNAPHFPIEPPAEWLAKVQQRAPQLDDKRAKNVAFVEHLDDGIGRVLAALRKRAWTRTRWSFSPPTTAARCPTRRTTIPGATASRATTTAACACRSWSAGRATSSPARAAITRD